jgi:hypothetical protein
LISMSNHVPIINEYPYGWVFFRQLLHVIGNP